MGTSTDKSVFTGVLLTIWLLGQSIAVAEESGRPDNLTLASFQFETSQPLGVQPHARGDPHGKYPS